jgi:uncharacterized protein (DUF305 family)
MKKSIAIAACLFLIPTGFSFAQHQGHGSHTGQSTPATVSPAAKAFADANAKMHRDMQIPFVGNAEHDFVRGMIPHHQGAIDTSEIVLKFGKINDIRKLAESIMKAQNSEIAEMQAWLVKNPTPSASSDSVAIKAAFAAANAKMHKDMTIKFSNVPDKDFLMGMVPHHEAAVAMARILLQYGKDPQLVTLAGNIIESQNREINQMRAFLAKL